MKTIGIVAGAVIGVAIISALVLWANIYVLTSGASLIFER